MQEGSFTREEPIDTADPADAYLDDPRHDQPAYDGPVKAYILASTHRTGSTLLCHLLAATGRLGVPSEYFRGKGMMPVAAARLGAVAEDGALRFPTYLRALLRCRTTPNGVFGAKVHFHQAEANLPQPAFRRLAAGATYVWLRRRDLVGQAISYAIARRTATYLRPTGAASPAAGVPFDLREALAALHSILQYNGYWQLYFEANAIVPLEVWYEDLLSDPDPVCRRIAGTVGVTLVAPVSIAQAPIERQRRSVNAEWREQLLEALRIRRPVETAVARGDGARTELHRTERPTVRADAGGAG
ncbi:MAG: Stf0 family sulfotransferase [Alphaproteobacteria bacterium]